MATHQKNSSTVRNSGQQGGTLLGLVIGLIIGLGIALVVALSITKTGLPFTNKGAQPRAVEDSSGAILADPNKPLYGNKDAAKEAARDFTKPAAEDVPAILPESKPPTTVKPAVESKAPLVEKSTAEKPSATKPDASAEKYIYYLQAGAFREQADADNAKAKLALLGFEARVTERLSDSGTLYRVRVGPFSQIEIMNGTREKLSQSGIDVAVVRSPK
ncbi:MAG: SPOR domain-containing protein [Glaciimonas sp.]|nr:SPOR domain-containing protein [Glaciimonas sp.]